MTRNLLDQTKKIFSSSLSPLTSSVGQSVGDEINAHAHLWQYTTWTECSVMITPIQSHTLPAFLDCRVMPHDVIKSQPGGLQDFRLCYSRVFFGFRLQVRNTKQSSRRFRFKCCLNSLLSPGFARVQLD